MSVNICLLCTYTLSLLVSSFSQATLSALERDGKWQLALHLLAEMSLVCDGSKVPITGAIGFKGHRV